MIVAVTLAGLAGSTSAAQPQCPVDIVGSWRLVSASSASKDGTRNDAPYGRSPSGLLIYTADGRVSVIITDGDRQPLSVDDRAAAPLEERARAFSSLLAYAGRYSFSCDRVVHHVEVASVPNWVGTDFARGVKFEGSRLILSTPPRRVGGTFSSFQLVWERAK